MSQRDPDIALATLAQAVPDPIAEPSPAVPHASARAHNLRGIVAMVAAVGAFSLMDALLKTLTPHYPAVQVAAMRGMAALPLVVAYVLWRRQLGSVVRVRWPLHLLRGVLNITMLSLFAFALRELGLSEAYTIFFIAPLLITALSGPVLGERVLRAHWIAIGVGFVGVLVALRPQHGALLSWGALAVLGAALCYALSALTGRVLARTDTSASLVFSTTAMLALGAGLLAAPHWVALQSAHWPLLAGLAITGFCGQLAITEAFRHGQASVVAPFEYTALAWGMALDWLLWQAVPGATTLLGGAIVIGCGLYIVRHERR